MAGNDSNQYGSLAGNGSNEYGSLAGKESNEYGSNQYGSLVPLVPSFCTLARPI